MVRSILQSLKYGHRPGATRISAASIAILGLAALLYALSWADAPVRGGDSGGYLDTAADLVDGRFDSPPFRAPAYPLLLLATNSVVQPTRALFYCGLLLHFIASMLVLATVARYTGRAFILIPIAVWMALPHNFQSSAQVMTETLCQLFLALLVYSILGWAHHRNWSYLAYAAGAAVLAALTRPTYQLLPLLLVPVVFLITEEFRPIAIFGLVSMLLLGAYAWHNQRRFGFFGITWSLGANLCNRTVYFLEDSPPSPLRDAMIAGRNRELIAGKSHTALQFQWNAWNAMKSAAGAHSDVELATTLNHLNRQLILRRPLNYISSVVSAAARVWLPYITDHASFGSRFLQAIWSGIHFLILACFFCSVWLIGGASVLAATRPGYPNPIGNMNLRLAFWLSALLPFYTVLISAMFDVGDPRQRFPTDFCFAVHLGVACATLTAWYKGTVSPPQSLTSKATG